MSQRHANRLVEAAEVVEKVGPIGPAPTTESQARALVPLKDQPEKMAEAMRTAADRRAAVAPLAAAGASTRAIAATLGVAQRTVARDVAALTADGALDARRRVAGLDGRRHPARKPRRRPRGPLAAHRYEPRPYRLADLELLAGAGSFKALARRLGVQVRTLYRWRGSGLTVDQADELAGRLGRHPSEVWPTWS